MATWTCNKDARIATKSGSSLGAGASDFNPIGLHVDGYLYRTLLGFSYSFAGMTGISQASLHIRTSTRYYTGFGSDPDIRILRLLASWSEGSSTGLSGSNAVNWSNQPSADPTYVFSAMPETESTWIAIDITVLMQEAFAAGVFYGLRLTASNEANEADTTEIYSREQGSSDPYITYTPITNVAPTVPTGCTPTGGGVATGGFTPTLAFDHKDADADALKNYDLQVSTDINFATATHWNITAQTTGITANRVARVYAGTALTAGATYYWRARTRSNTGILTDSPWTTAQAFKVNTPAVAAFVQPSAADALIEMVKTAGVATNPRMVVRWSFVDADGPVQKGYKVTVVNDNNTAFYTGVYTAGTATSFTVPVDAVRGAFYKVTVEVTDSTDVVVTIPQRRCKAQWAVAEYRIDLLGTVTAWSSVASSTAPTNTKVVTEYASSAAGTAIGTWYASIANAALGRWFHFRVFLFAWSGAASPSLTKMVVTYTSQVGVPPDGWTVTGQHSLDSSARVYGTQSLKVAGNGATVAAWQLVPVQKNTDYILSGRIKSDGNSGAFVSIAQQASLGNLAGSPAVAATQDFTRMVTPVWNSGDNDEIYIQCRSNGAVGTAAWFDALKLEASTVVTSWNPGLVGAGLSVDAGGIKVDASLGAEATFRLQGSAGGVRDTVELGTTGLVFGGDVLLESPLANLLRAYDAAIRSRRANAGDEAFSTHEAASNTLRWRVNADGQILWGPTSGSLDTNLYRAGANYLKTDDALEVVGNLLPTGPRSTAAMYHFAGTIATATGVVNLNPIGIAAGQIPALYNCRCVGIAITVATARTGGTATARWRVNNTTRTSPAAVVDGTNTQRAIDRIAYAAAQANSTGFGSFMTVEVQTVGFGPLANTVYVDLMLVFDDVAA